MHRCLREKGAALSHDLQVLRRSRSGMSLPPLPPRAPAELDLLALLTGPSARLLRAEVALPAGRTWRGTFRVGGRAIQLQQRGADEPCVSVELAGSERHPALKLKSLFYEIEDPTRCEMDSQERLGEAVLRVLSHVARRLGASLKLDDAAYFRGGAFRLTSMSHFLRMQRGFGLYEARGFVPSEIDRTCGKDVEQILQVVRVELQWTRAIATTQIQKLPAAIDAFFDELQRLDGKAKYALEAMYTEETRRLSKLAAELLLLWLSTGPSDSEYMRELGALLPRLRTLRSDLDDAFQARPATPPLPSITLRDACALEPAVGDPLLFVGALVWRKTWNTEPMEWRDLVKRIQDDVAVQVAETEDAPLASLARVPPVELLLTE